MLHTANFDARVFTSREHQRLVLERDEAAGEYFAAVHALLHGNLRLFNVTILAPRIYDR